MAPKKRKLETAEKNAQQKLSKFDATTRKYRIDLEAVECPVCTETIVPPIETCAESHIICSSCAGQCNRRCPQCRGPISLRNRALEKMVEKLVVPCGNAARGCTATFLGASIQESCQKAAAHEVHCRYAPLSRCPFSPACQCTETEIEDLNQHLMLKHGLKEERLHKYDGDFKLNLTGPYTDGMNWTKWGTFRGERIAYRLRMVGREFQGRFCTLRSGGGRALGSVSVAIGCAAPLTSGNCMEKIIFKFAQFPDACDDPATGTVSFPRDLLSHLNANNMMQISFS